MGLTTDISRINASKLCGKLGVEHIIRSAKIDERRSRKIKFICVVKKTTFRNDTNAQAGDKGFYEYGENYLKN